ncbi:MAG: ribonuclease P protein component [Candidatus Kerfeldbacteria bacterium]
MLPAAHRLRRKEDYDRVYKGGKTLHTALFRIKTAPNKGEETRFGIVIPNKAIKRAFARNRKKRQVRSALGELLPGIKKGEDVVLIAQPQLDAASYADILADLREGLQKIGFIQTNNEETSS